MQTVSIIREKFMKKIIVTFIATITAALLLCFSVSAFDNNDYGGGGGYDFGGGDYGGNDYGGNDYGSSSYSGDTDPVSVIIGIGIVVVIIIISTIGGNKKKSGGGTTRPSSMNGANVVLPNRTEQIEGIIKQKDPNFSASDLISFTKQVYIDIENAWCKRDMTPVRPVMHENLYNTTCKQVQAKIEQGVVYHYESIAIDTAYLTSYERDSQFEYVTAYLSNGRCARLYAACVKDTYACINEHTRNIACRERMRRTEAGNACTGGEKDGYMDTGSYNDRIRGASCNAELYHCAVR